MTEILKPYRDKIDTLDDQIIDLLSERLDVVHEVIGVKSEHGIPAVLPDRIEEVRERCAKRAESKKNLDPDVIRQLYTLLIDYCCAEEEKIIKR